MPHYLAISKDRQHDILDLIGNQLKAAAIVRAAAPGARDAEGIALRLEFLADYLQQTLAGEVATDEMRAYFKALEKE